MVSSKSILDGGPEILLDKTARANLTKLQKPNRVILGSLLDKERRILYILTKKKTPLPG
jgi:hypothetical protein